MLIFVDESYAPAGAPNAKTTFAAVVVDEKNYRDLERDLYRLRKHFFKNPDPYAVEFRGRLLLSERAIELPKNREFIRQLIYLCKEHKLVPFAVVQNGSITLASQSDYLPNLYRGILWRVNTLMEERYADRMATVFFDSIDHETNRRVAISFTNFMVRHFRGTQYVKVLPTPFFCDSSVTPPMQIADIVAYCVNQRYSGRRGELEEFFQEFRQMTHNYQNEDQGLLLWEFQLIPPEPAEPIWGDREGGAQQPEIPLGGDKKWKGTWLSYDTRRCRLGNAPGSYSVSKVATYALQCQGLFCFGAWGGGPEKPLKADPRRARPKAPLITA